MCGERVSAEINDALYITVGNKPITKSDVKNEIKLILILNNESYKKEKSEKYYDSAVKSLIERKIKLIEIEKNNIDQLNEDDINKELNRLAKNINVDLDTLKNIFSSNDLDFSAMKDRVKVELLWNSLIFNLYRSRVKIDPEKINEKIITLKKEKRKINEYLVSEIVIQSKDINNIEFEISELIKTIETEGFENTAKRLSIAESAVDGGALGWIQEDKITNEVKKVVDNTPVGKLSEAIVLQDGILIFKIRSKREATKNTNVEKLKEELVFIEKNKILSMHSLSHYDKVKRSIAINFYK